MKDVRRTVPPIRDETAPKLELDTYMVLDHRNVLAGRIGIPAGDGREVALSLTRAQEHEPCWRRVVPASPGRIAPAAAFSLPLAGLPGGYYRLEARTEAGETTAVTIALHEVRPVRPGPLPNYLAFVTDTMSKLLAHQVKRLEGSAAGTPCVTVSRKSNLSYRSLGHFENGSFRTCWFPEQPFEMDAFRIDHEIWSVLDRLSEFTGKRMYRDSVTAMLDAVAAYGFDPESGLMYLSEECDFDVVRCVPCHSTRSDIPPRFKPRNTGHRPEMYLDRLWERMPHQLHRCFRAMYYGLVTDPETFDYNRFCTYDFSDADRKPSQERNSGHCAFDTTGGRMVHWWCSCWARTGDTDCLSWAQRMADKWQAVMHPDSGLVPNFFGAAASRPGAAQRPGKWAETRGAALTAASWMDAAAELIGHPGAEGLREQLTDMALRLARGLAARVYDAARGRFREHLHLDGRPYENTARYCFGTQEEKDAAVARDPELTWVPVYDGAGWYRPPTYFEHCAGVGIPLHLTQVAAATGDSFLLAKTAEFAAMAVEASRQLEGPFTPEGLWTFRASGWYIRMCLLLYRATADRRYLQWGTELADREIAALGSVVPPHWWRMRERSIFLEALLELHRELCGAKQGQSAGTVGAPES
ncbi:MAG: hypothetical protein GXP31_13925 [Kiritimatiellaeota bacterium]|nr:hypothetical protein [Kiritimatiellota bacterium]